MYFGEKNSWTIRELIYSWQKKDTKDLKVINDLICIETLCNWTEFNTSLSLIFNFFNSCQIIQQTALCHTTSPSKRREKGEQEKWKTSLQSKLFIEIVKIGRYFMYGDIYCTGLTHFTWIRCLVVDCLLFPPF